MMLSRARAGIQVGGVASLDAWIADQVRNDNEERAARSVLLVIPALSRDPAE
jgi:hypothetical protein